MRDIAQEDIIRIRSLLSTHVGNGGFVSVMRMGGLTNRTYKVIMDSGEIYVVRLPGEGTEEMICRGDERISTKLACNLGIDSKLLYFGDDGTKISEYIPNAVTMSAQQLRCEERIKQVAELLQVLHTCGVDTGVPFDVFDMALSYETIIAEKEVCLFSDYESMKQCVMEIKAEVDGSFNVVKVPCHNDPLCENWVLSDRQMYLIDWEYAGMNDGMWDVADVSIEADFDETMDESLLRHYLGREPDVKDKKHFVANKIYVDYLWTLWAKARVPYDGQPMEDWATERYARLKRSLKMYSNL